MPNNSVHSHVSRCEYHQSGYGNGRIEHKNCDRHQCSHHNTGVHLHERINDPVGYPRAFLRNLVGELAAAATGMEKPGLVHIVLIKPAAQFRPNARAIHGEAPDGEHGNNRCQGQSDQYAYAGPEQEGTGVLKTAEAVYLCDVTLKLAHVSHQCHERADREYAAKLCEGHQDYEALEAEELFALLIGQEGVEFF